MMTETVLVPQPRKFIPGCGEFEISEKDINLLNSYILGAERPGCIETIVTDDEGTEGAEWYSIRVDNSGISVQYHDERGFFYAVQTLRQLMSAGKPNSISFCEIEDNPDYPVRGVLLDVSRDRVPTMETLKGLIDSLASWKYNHLELYIEHTFAYSKHSIVWKNASPFTAEEIIGIKQYCALRCIELVPNQNSFGHMERWLQHDEYKHLAESPDGFTDPWGVFRETSSTLAPAVPETLDFLDSLYDELLPCFDSEFLNVGGDEPWELGKGRTGVLCEKEGLENVYLNFLMKIRELAAAKGKRIQIYGDIIMKYPMLIKELPKDLILVNWGYEADHPFEDECEKIAASGIPFYICAGTSAWNSVGGRWSNTKKNIANGARNGLKYGAEGFIVSEWGDNGHWQQYTAGLPGFLYGAAAAWNAGAIDSFDIEKSGEALIFHNVSLAEASGKLQDVWACSCKPLHNVSLPAVVMLDPTYPYYREAYKYFKGYGFSEELELIGDAEELLAAAPDSVMKDELCFTSALLKHGCRLGRDLFAAESLTIEGIPEEQRKQLSEELKPLMKEYVRLWNIRSRPGGLKESYGRFEALLNAYKGQS